MRHQIAINRYLVDKINKVDVPKIWTMGKMKWTVPTLMKGVRSLKLKIVSIHRRENKRLKVFPRILIGTHVHQALIFWEITLKMDWRQSLHHHWFNNIWRRTFMDFRSPLIQNQSKNVRFARNQEIYWRSCQPNVTRRHFLAFSVSKFWSPNQI